MIHNKLEKNQTLLMSLRSVYFFPSAPQVLAMFNTKCFRRNFTQVEQQCLLEITEVQELNKYIIHLSYI